MSIKQISVSYDNFSYIIYCNKTKKAAVTDPSFDATKAIDFIKSNNLELIYIINTHYHSDHTNANKDVKASFPNSNLVASKLDGKYISGVDVFVNDSEELKLGEVNIKFLLTPGHTKGGLCIIVDNKAILTGDTLFIGDCGRCDLSGGNLSEMFNSIQKIKSLSDDLLVYPGHDYGNKPFDTLGNQKNTNKVLLAENLEDFSKI